MCNSNLKRRLKIIVTTSPRVLAEVARRKLGNWFAARRQRLYVLFLLNRRRRFLRDRSLCRVREDIRFFCFGETLPDRAALRATWTRDFHASVVESRRAAEQTLEHRFDLLGSGPVSLGPHIDWSRDFKSGRKWDRRYFERIPEIKLRDDSDIKVPWELSRFYHFVPLGKAFLESGDERYVREFLEELDDWAEQNPPYHSVNWHCAMEVAIRAVNWIWGYFFFKDSDLFTPEKKQEFALRLYFHGEYIYSNLECCRRVIDGKYVRQNGNHYVADLVGLIYLGLVLDTPKARAWLSTGLSELSAELRVQVLPDGVHWELSPSYHRLVLEMALSAAILASQNQHEFDATTLAQLEKMLDYTASYLRPDALCPLVGDADDGRMHILGINGQRDHRHLLAVGALLFDRADLLVLVDEKSREDSLWLFGRKKYEAMKSWEPEVVVPRSMAFPEAGFCILRDAGDLHVMISCAGTGMRGNYGGHSHSDALSFEFFVRGESFLTDSGTYVYSGDPEWRNRFRSTEAHNTIRVDGEEIDRFDPDVLFNMKNDAAPRVLRWDTSDTMDYLEAEHYGYRRLPQPITHRRRFLLDRKLFTFMVEDQLTGHGLHEIEAFWHVAPGVKVESREPGQFVLLGQTSSIGIAFENASEWQYDVLDSWVSEGYGRKSPAFVLRMSSRRTLPVCLRTCLQYGETDIRSSRRAFEVASLHLDSVRVRG